jgi:hypothetical protein
MVCGRPPFTLAQPNDPLYRCIVANRVDVYWKRQTKEHGENFCSQEFKDLMNCMWQFDPVQRPNISEVLYHKWTQGPVPSESAVLKKLADRNARVKEAQMLDREKMLDEKNDRLSNRQVGLNYRSA